MSFDTTAGTVTLHTDYALAFVLLIIIALGWAYMR